MACSKCGSFAINENSHGRIKGFQSDLCDVCYWRAIATGSSNGKSLILEELKNLLKEALSHIDTNDDGFEAIDGEGWYTKCRCCGARSTMSRNSENSHTQDCELNEALESKIELKKKIYYHLDMSCGWL